MAEENDAVLAYMTALKDSAGAAAAGPSRASSQKADAASADSGQPSFQGGEKRRSARYKCEGSVELCEVGCDVYTQASFTDISVHGCYVEAQATYPVGTSLHMKLQVNDSQIEASGTVRVNYPYQGMGIAFVEMTDENRTLLRELIKSLMRPARLIEAGVGSLPPARGSSETAPSVSDPAAAIRALVEFFEHRKIVTREDFLRVLRHSQETSAKR